MTIAGTDDSLDQSPPGPRARTAMGLRRAAWWRSLVRWRPSYRASLILSISLLVVATGSAVGLLAFRGGRASTTVLAHSLFQEVSDHAVTLTRDFLRRAEPIGLSLSNLAGLGLAVDDPDQLARQLAAILRAYPGVSWVSFSNEAGAFVGAYHTPGGGLRVNQSRIVEGHTHLTEHDVLGDGSWKPYRTDNDSGYDPRRRPFYQQAKDAGTLVWLPPYIFYEQGVPGVTCAQPLYGPGRQFRGVLTVDFDLNTLSQFVHDLSVSPHSRLFIMTADGVLLAHPTRRLAVRAGQRDRGELMTIHDVNDPLIETFNAQLRDEDRAAPAGADRARQFDFTHDGVPYFARATAFSIDGRQSWVLGAMAPQADFLAPVQQTNTLVLATSLVALLVAVLLAGFLARRVSGPILSLVSFMRTVGAGDLSGRADLGGTREFRQLSGAINQMIADLRDRMHLRTALAVAMEVQQKLLPAEAPHVPGLDIAGFSAYCDETGGDYYDYLVPDKANPNRVLVAVGDVMGHGIPAALLMAGARAILHSRAPACGDLGELLMHLNDLLAEDMLGGRFMTMLLWCIDPVNHTVQWASAGHDPAILYDPKTDEFDETAPGGVPLGIESGYVYEESVYAPVRPGQVIILGTDGVWETRNLLDEEFGKDRLRETVRSAAAGSALEIAAAISRDLNAFRAGAKQEDDITLVVIKVLPSQDHA